MVAKINIGNSLFGVLSYNQAKMNAGEGKILCSNKVFLPTDNSLTLAFCMKSFENHIPKDIKTEKPVIHISLNPHPDDVLSDEQFSAIAGEYLDQMGYGNQPYVVYKHEDINRHHIHIVSLRVDEHGKKINDKFEFRRSKEITRGLEQKYGLKAADKKSLSNTLVPPKVDYKKGNVKKQIANMTKRLADSYRFQSIGEYKTLLLLFNLGMAEVKGEFEGKPYHGIVYFALDKKGRKQGQPIKASLIGGHAGADGLKKRCSYNNQLLKKNNLTESTRLIIKSALKTSKNKNQFIRQLQNQDIDVFFRENRENRIYGVTFIDHNQHTALNGSRYGKEFSANTFNEKFGPQNPSQTVAETNTEDYYPKYEDLTDGLFSFFDFTGQGENYEEEAFIRRMKRKRKSKK